MKISLLLSLGLGWQTAVWAAEPKPIAVAVGQQFKIALESTQGGDYQWVLARPLDEKKLKFLENEYRRGVPRPGGGKTCEVLSFQALGEGKTEIDLKYGRLFEKNVAPAQKTNFVVIITRELK